jgi:hypothetical protein
MGRGVIGRLVAAGDIELTALAGLPQHYRAFAVGDGFALNFGPNSLAAGRKY